MQICKKIHKENEHWKSYVKEYLLVLNYFRAYNSVFILQIEFRTQVLFCVTKFFSITTRYKLLCQGKKKIYYIQTLTVTPEKKKYVLLLLYIT